MSKLPRYSLIGVLVCSVGMLVGNPAAQASDSSKLRVKIAKLEKANKTLRAQLAATRAKNASLVKLSETAITSLTTCYGERDSARTLLSADTTTRLNTMPVADLWGVLAVFKTRFDANGGATFRATVFQGSSYSSYSFDRWGS